MNVEECDRVLFEKGVKLSTNQLNLAYVEVDSEESSKFSAMVYASGANQGYGELHFRFFNEGSTNFDPSLTYNNQTIFEIQVHFDKHYYNIDGTEQHPIYSIRYYNIITLENDEKKRVSLKFHNCLDGLHLIMAVKIAFLEILEVLVDQKELSDN